MVSPAAPLTITGVCLVVVVEDMSLLTFELAGQNVEGVATRAVVHMLKKTKTPGKALVLFWTKAKAQLVCQGLKGFPTLLRLQVPDVGNHPHQDKKANKNQNFHHRR